MDLLAFIRTADPTKVRVAERRRAEDEPRLLESSGGRVVSLLPIAPACASSELEASVDKLFDEGASGDRGDADVRPVAMTTDTIVKDVAPLQPRLQRKRKNVVADAGGPSHPPKKLREDYGALDAEARGESIPTLPFVTFSVSATPEREDRSPANFVPRLNLQTIGAPQRFVISSDSSHHFGANIAEAEVDSIVRYSASAIATITTVTAVIDTDATATRAPVVPSLFGVGSYSTGRTDSIPGGFSDVPGSDFLLVVSVLLSTWTLTSKKFMSRNGVKLTDLGLMTVASVLFIEFNVRATRQISLNAEVRMRAAYNIREKRKLRAIVDEQGELLKAKDGEIESLKA
nr:hypothetical protein [Tanacetum cinerariifolium]